MDMTESTRVIGEPFKKNDPINSSNVEILETNDEMADLGESFV